MIPINPHSMQGPLPPIGDEMRCRAVLLQTIHATLDLSSYVGYYIEPNRDVALSYPIEKESVDTDPLLDEEYLPYEFGGNHRYRRLPDGKLTERLSSDEPDYACMMDVITLKNTHFERFTLRGLDADGNLYGTCGYQFHWIYVYSSNRQPLAKFRLLGTPAIQYIAGDGCLCVVTDNVGREKKRCKNLLRVYRLELPKRKMSIS